MSGERILLTGASGFVGRYLLHDLIARGYLVRAAGRSSISAITGAEHVAIGDLGAPVDWQPLLDGVDHVVHSAGLAHADGDIPEERYQQVNTQATLALARAAHAAGVRRFVFLSSIRAQAGSSAPAPLSEADAPAPTDPYGRSKLAAEQALAETGLDWVALRPVLVYGAGVKGNMAALLKLARTPYPLPLASLTGRRSLVSVESLAGAVATVLEAPGPLRRPLVVADSEPLTLPEMLAALRAGLGRRPGLLPCPVPLIGLACRAAGREAAFDRLSGSLVARAEGLEALGWRPALASRDGLAALARAEG